ncbi:hypothetical protein MtrunA17_Chr2g0296961 [Medicago truncatula]|uniref:Transmembrane protein n=1 Tax=Medicago truncatula TaxID=3880 RepID=A0A396J5B2_MEDTR|nr:hypothetical protein MtrunA17_Chr2g0296961 [Medicago truncatula]
MIFLLENIFILFFCSNSSMARAHTIKYGEVGCLRFEYRSLHKLYNILIN